MSTIRRLPDRPAQRRPARAVRGEGPVRPRRSRPRRPSASSGSAPRQLPGRFARPRARQAREPQRGRQAESGSSRTPGLQVKWRKSLSGPFEDPPRAHGCLRKAPCRSRPSQGLFAGRRTPPGKLQITGPPAFFSPWGRRCPRARPATVLRGAQREPGNPTAAALLSKSRLEGTLKSRLIGPRHTPLLFLRRSPQTQRSWELTV